MLVLNLGAKLAILRTKKDFLIYSTRQNKVVLYQLTNDLKAYHNGTLTNFKLVSILQKEIFNNLIN